MCGIPAKKSRDRLDNGLLIDVPEIPGSLIFATTQGDHGNREKKRAVRIYPTALWTTGFELSASSQGRELLQLRLHVPSSKLLGPSFDLLEHVLDGVEEHLSTICGQIVYTLRFNALATRPASAGQEHQPMTAERVRSGLGAVR